MHGLCLFTYSDVQHILCFSFVFLRSCVPYVASFSRLYCVFVLFFFVLCTLCCQFLCIVFVLCTLCCQFLCIVHFWLSHVYLYRTLVMSFKKISIKPFLWLLLLLLKSLSDVRILYYIVFINMLDFKSSIWRLTQIRFSLVD